MSAIFDDILRGIQLQPLILHRAAVKAEPRRFPEEPERITAMQPLERSCEQGCNGCDECTDYGEIA